MRSDCPDGHIGPDQHDPLLDPLPQEFVMPVLDHAYLIVVLLLRPIDGPSELANLLVQILQVQELRPDLFGECLSERDVLLVFCARPPQLVYRALVVLI